jgi:hypothetical protein
MLLAYMTGLEPATTLLALDVSVIYAIVKLKFS